jgi:hypothetical protein
MPTRKGEAARAQFFGGSLAYERRYADPRALRELRGVSLGLPPFSHGLVVNSFEVVIGATSSWEVARFMSLGTR